MGINLIFVYIQAELTRRNSEENAENIPLPKKTIVVLKKELAQKTEALNKALKRENELKVGPSEVFHFVFTPLQCLVSKSSCSTSLNLDFFGWAAVTSVRAGGSQWRSGCQYWLPDCHPEDQRWDYQCKKLFLWLFSNSVAFPWVLMFYCCVGSPPAARSERRQSGWSYPGPGHQLWHGEITPRAPPERENHDWWRQPARSTCFYWRKYKKKI